MSAWLIALCGCIYLYVSVEQILRNEWSISLMYFGYAVANIGAWHIAQHGIKH